MAPRVCREFADVDRTTGASSPFQKSSNTKRDGIATPTLPPRPSSTPLSRHRGEPPQKRHLRRVIKNSAAEKGSGASSPVQKSPYIERDGIATPSPPPRPSSTPLWRRPGTSSRNSARSTPTPPVSRPASRAMRSPSPDVGLDGEDGIDYIGNWSMHSSLCAKIVHRPSLYDIEKWNQMAGDDIKLPKKISTRSSMIRQRVEDGTLKLDERELNALLSAQEEKEKDDEESSDNSSESSIEAPKVLSPPKNRRGSKMSFQADAGRRGSEVAQLRRYALNRRSILVEEIQKMKDLHFGPGQQTMVIAERIAKFFNQQGVLNRSSPTHWALQVCEQKLHEEVEPDEENKKGLSRRQQLKNAKNTLELDQMRRDAKIQYNSELRNEDPRLVFTYDAQQERYLRLMFEPIVDFWENMPDEILDESLDRATRRKSSRKNKSPGARKGKCLRDIFNVVRQGTHLFRVMGGNRGSQRGSVQSVGRQVDQSTNQALGSGMMTNEQRTMLLCTFQRYVMRVSGNCIGSELVMARSTWFRFLHHCGILGPHITQDAEQESQQGGGTLWGLAGPLRVPTDLSSKTEKSEEPEFDIHRQGGASFSHASAVFAMYSEANLMGVPMLTFANWVSAIQHILRGPNFYRTAKEMNLNLFGVCLKRCENVLGITKEGMSPKNSSRTSVRPGGGGDSPSRRELYDSSDMPRVVLHEQIPGVLGWQSHLAEEQICEPEVLLMLHEYEVPLRTLFEYYASRSYREPETMPQRRNSYNRNISKRFVEVGDINDRDDSENELHGDAITSKLQDVDEDTNEATMAMEEHTPSFSTLPGKSQFVQALDLPKRETLMDPKDFRFMAYDFGFFPNLVQLHSVMQHMDMSLTRRNASQLTYEAFIECLLRITFVYLSIYGNNIQQASFSKAKCMWLLTLLRVRCNELKLPNGLSAEAPPADSNLSPPGSPYGSHGGVRFCGALWEETNVVNVDTMLLENLVLWTTMDAEAAAPERPVARASKLSKLL